MTLSPADYAALNAAIADLRAWNARALSATVRRPVSGAPRKEPRFSQAPYRMSGVDVRRA